MGSNGLQRQKLLKYLTQTFMSHGNEMICQPVTLSGDAEWPKVADAVIEAQIYDAPATREDEAFRFLWRFPLQSTACAAAHGGASHLSVHFIPSTAPETSCMSVPMLYPNCLLELEGAIHALLLSPLLTILNTSSSLLRKVSTFSQRSKKGSLRKYGIFNATFSET